MKMYNGNEHKVDHIYNVAREFRHYLIAEDVGNLVDEFINEKEKKNSYVYYYSKEQQQAHQDRDLDDISSQEPTWIGYSMA